MYLDYQKPEGLYYSTSRPLYGAYSGSGSIFNSNLMGSSFSDPTLHLRGQANVQAMYPVSGFQFPFGSRRFISTHKSQLEYDEEPEVLIKNDASKTVLDNELDELKSNLPWLESILNANYTISLSTGIYDLGLNASISTTKECDNSLLKKHGDCVLLKRCPQIFEHVPDKQSFESYFCNLNGYAGICCPKVQQAP